MKQIIYQVLPRLWGSGKLSFWDEASLSYVKSLGTDFIWFTGIPRHASGKDFVKGDPGCPYSISDWKDVNPYLADDPFRRMDEFKDLVSRVHEAGMKVMIDYIPNHVAKDYSGPIRHFDWCDADWTDTLKNDWSSPETFRAMVDILSFWASLGVDGFRCDMVELVPPESLAALIAELRKCYPSLFFVAEVYGKNNYRRYVSEVGFDLLYDKSGLYDRMRSICCNGASARELTWNWQWLEDLQPNMLDFLENHDEQRVASREFLGSAAKSFAPLAFSLLFNTASFLLYFGQELGEDASDGCAGRTSIFDIKRPASVSRLTSDHCKGGRLLPEEKEILARYRQLFATARRPVFASGNVWDLCYCNYSSPGFSADRHFAFVRYDSSETWLVFCNFSSSSSYVTLNIPYELRSVCGSNIVEAGAGANDYCLLRLR